MKRKKKKIAAIMTALCMCAAVLVVPSFAATSDDTIDLTVNVKYCQTEARSMLELINDFRTGDDAWYWDSSDSEQVYVELEDLTYDYSLEAVAMQRAAEIAVSFSHTRPNGTLCWTAYDGVYVYTAVAENIAAGQTSAEAAFEAWQEEDYGYSGQGHRRNMLSSSVTSIGIACVYYDGYYYWVQDFGKSSTTNTTATEANDSSTDVTVTVSESYISNGSLSLSEDEVSLELNSTADLPDVTLTASVEDHWPSNKTVSGTVAEDDVTWSSANETIASVGSIKANGIGETTFTATVMDKYTAELSVTVTAISINDFTATLSQTEYEYDSTAKTPSVTVTDASGNTLIQDTDYTVSYSDNVNVGTATVTITGRGDYTGTITKTFTITECSHNYTSSVTKEATCSEEGVMTYTCSKCGDTYTASIEKTAHTEGEDVVENSVKETCETDGSYDTVVYCSVCGEEISRETTTISATGHDYDYDNITWAWEEDYSSATATVTCNNDSTHIYTQDAKVTSETKEATCTEDGQTTYTATITENETEYKDVKTVVLDALGHTESEAVLENVVASTCTESGSYDSVVYCSVCGEELSRETVTTDALGHTQGDAVTENNVDATCETDGSYDTVIYCTVCGAELSRTTTTVDALGHAYNYNDISWTWEEDYSSATATVTCENDDNHTLTHTAEITVETVEATCTENGYTSYTATITVSEATYENTKTVTINATGHTAGDAVTENSVAATCEDDGSYDTVIYCTVCGEELSRETTTISAIGHDYDYDGITWAWAEDYSSATATVTCENDSTHTYTYDADITSVTTAATCTEDGQTTYTATITVNETTYTDTKEVTLEALGHTAGEAVIENKVESTCTEEGSYDNVVYCTVCGEELSRETVTTAALGHTAGKAATENEVAATCEEDGSYDTVVYCTVCGEELSRETVTVAATGHTYVSEVTTEATCTEEGVLTYTCSVCGDTYTEAIAATGHSYVSEVTTEATCTEEGVLTYTCSVCGDIYTEAIAATGHSYVSEITKEATTTKEGILTYTCSVCGDTYTETISKLESSEDEDDASDDAQTDDGNDSSDASDDTDTDDSSSGSPATGQTDSVGSWVLMASAAALALVAAMKKKKQA